MSYEWIVGFALILLMASTVPIGVALFLSAFLGFAFFTEIDLLILGQTMIIKLDNFAFLAVLFFVLAGNIMSSGAMVTKLINFANKLVGFIRGGLAISGVCSQGLFGVLSGSDLAAIASISRIMIPALKEKNYGKRFSIGIMTSSAILAIIVPPSIPMIVIAMITGDSIARLFMAGFLPGLLIVTALSLYSVFASKKFDIERVEFPGIRGLALAFKDGFWALLTPIIIFGGIFTGFCTASEAAAVAAGYALIVELFMYKGIKISDLPEIFYRTGITVAAILLLVAGGATFADYITFQQIPSAIAHSISNFTESPLLFLILINIFLLVVGMFLDIMSAMLILMPIFITIVPEFGINITHFAVIFILNLGIGYITPPMGLNLFMVMALLDSNLTEVARAVLPCFLILLVVLFLITYLPSISLFLPQLFGMI
jgi:C4-dicarboxylate transporter DctM subunit